ncbi:MAG TPA: hypothetical protein VMC84_11690 [Methanocella sp.]|nr:hypothetical protein [Methanocella sp.]
MRAGLLSDDTGVTSIVEYIVTFIIASILFSIVLLMANSMFIDGPQRTVSKVQFTDIGNDLTAKVVDTYLIAPEPGEYSTTFDVSTTFDMPLTVASNSYMADIGSGNNPNQDDREIDVYSPSNGVSINMTLNGISSTIPVNGSTSSLSGTHRIYYQRK